MATPPDFTAGQVLTAAQMNAVGLWLIKSQTIGTTVSSVAVTDVFSADFDAYKITITGGVGSSAQRLTIQIGAATTGYYYTLAGALYSDGTFSAVNGNNTTVFDYAGSLSTDSLVMNVEILDPFATKNTKIGGIRPTGQTNAGGYVYGGYLANTTSYTGFTLGTNAGTLTGGTIRVYGYRK